MYLFLFCIYNNRSKYFDFVFYIILLCCPVNRACKAVFTHEKKSDTFGMEGIILGRQL